MLVSPGTQKENGGYVIPYEYLRVHGVYLRVPDRCDNGDAFQVDEWKEICCAETYLSLGVTMSARYPESVG